MTCPGRPRDDMQLGCTTAQRILQCGVSGLQRRFLWAKNLHSRTPRTTPHACFARGLKLAAATNHIMMLNNWSAAVSAWVSFLLTSFGPFLTFSEGQNSMICVLHDSVGPCITRFCPVVVSEVEWYVMNSEALAANSRTQRPTCET